MPRSTAAVLGHPRMQRPPPAAGDVGVPFSSRQKKARSKTRLLAQGSLPTARCEAQRRLMTSPQRWRRVNDALSEHAGDTAALVGRDQEDLRRVDRSIQACERRNDRRPHAVRQRGHAAADRPLQPATVPRTQPAPAAGPDLLAAGAPFRRIPAESPPRRARRPPPRLRGQAAQAAGMRGMAGKTTNCRGAGRG